MSNFLDALQQAQIHQPKQQSHITVTKTRQQRKMKMQKAREEEIQRNLGSCKFADFNQEKERTYQSLALQGMKLFLEQQDIAEAATTVNGQNQHELVYERTKWKVLEDSD
ncbi:hypothetical protein SS50377_24579 [Spironucleus salmonicida]|uniref:Uncharacterized protein n=1 Tax=Spironucleus salmonicida TaxID=348837 RepID=V6LJK6_9EUKA|nr:hypothetical protein SS50377_24579 [Spironucleus salmonicida]|eukprot:EST44563.1 Hypothetical protein SS50377_15565 [Spironucleus salmonicida]